MTKHLADYEVGIIGAGPAGSALAAYLAKAGKKCVIFERELFPRPHVGESLVPSSTRVFKDLDFLKVMEAQGFPRKYGATWTTVQGHEYDHDWDGLNTDSRADIRFEERQQPGVEQNYTYHVDRGVFDNLLLHHARDLGAEVFSGVGVKDVDVTGPLPEIKFALGSREVSCKVKILVDASGRRTFLGNKLRLKIKDPVFDQYAFLTWFEGYDRVSTMKNGQQKSDYIYIHFLPLTNSWVWQIPITNSITSIGVVTQRRHFPKEREAREAFFWEAISSRPELYQALRAAKQIRPFSEEGDYSYAMNQITGDGWLMVGDAGRFVDPIFSTGVSIALNSARFAHVDILRALESGNTSRASFATYEETLRRGTKNWYNFISVYYRLNVLFTTFVKDPRYRLDVLKLLQGDVYDEEEPAILAQMRAIVLEVENNPNHLWHKKLGDLTAYVFRPLF